MIDTVWRIVAVALIAVAIAVLLKKTNPDMAFLLTLAVSGAVIGVFAKFADETAVKFGQNIAALGLSEELFLPLIKTVAVAIITKAAGDICRDAGQSGIGNLVETAGAFAGVVISLPLFSAAWELLQDIL